MSRQESGVRTAETLRPGQLRAVAPQGAKETAARIVRAYRNAEDESTDAVRDAFVAFFRIEDARFDVVRFLRECA
jgi:hypothetical protein